MRSAEGSWVNAVIWAAQKKAAKYTDCEGTSVLKAWYTAPPFFPSISFNLFQGPLGKYDVTQDSSYERLA